MKKKEPKWKKFEKDIYNFLKEQYPENSIKSNHYIRGRYSKRKRQIDVLIEGFTGGRKFRQIVECKHYNEKLNVKIIESILGFLDDVGTDRAIIITNKGYSKSAYRRAHNDPRFIELQILSFKELKYYQGLYAFSYRGKNGVIIKAPMGWITDNSDIGSEATCNLYLRGSDLVKAHQTPDIIFINIFNKDFSEIETVEQFNKERNKSVKKRYKDAVITPNIDTILRNDAKIILDKILLPNEKLQYSGYIDFKEFVVTVDLVTSIDNESNRIPIVEQLLFEIKPYETIFDSDIDAAFSNMSDYYFSIIEQEEKDEFLKEITLIISEIKKESPNEIKYVIKYFENVAEVMKIIE